MRIKQLAKWGSFGLGIALITFALSAGLLGIDPNNGWGPRRQLTLLVGFLLLVIPTIFGYFYKFVIRVINSIFTRGFFTNIWSKLSSLFSFSRSQRIKLFGSAIGVKGNDQGNIKNKLESFVVSIVLVAVVFFDVIFLGTTITQNGALFPIRYESDGITPLVRQDLFVKLGELSGESDNGAIRWQEEPGICYMHFLIFDGESPYWDPYSSGGMPGVETMTDIKFSPISLIMALLGCNALVYNFVIVLFQIFALYFLNRTLRFHFGFSRLTGIVGCIVYLLNGFYIMNLNSQVVQNWLYFPVCLYLIINFCKKPTIYRFIGMIVGNILILSVTFMPTTAMLIVCIYVISFCFILGYYSSIKQYLLIFIAQLFAMVGGLLLLSVIYLPMYESFTIPHIYDHYFVLRDFIPLDFRAFLSFFSGKHFISALQYLPRYTQRGGAIAWFFGYDRIFYFGLMTGLVLIQSWVNKIYRRDSAIIGLTFLLIFGLGRLFQFPLIYQLWNIIPIFRTFAGPYVWVIPAFCVVFLASHGFETLSYDRFFKRWPILLVIYALMAYWIAYAYYWLIVREGAPISSINWVYISILLILLVIPVIIYFFIHIDNKRLNLYRGLLVVLIFSELFFYMNGTRYYRAESNNNTISSPGVNFIKKNIGLKRIANYGWTIWPQMGSAYQIQQIEGQNLGGVPWYINFFNTYLGGGHPLFPIMDTGRTNIDHHVLDLLDVKYIVVDQSEEKYINYYADANYPVVYTDNVVTIYENPDHYDRVFITHALSGKPFDPNGPIEKIATTDDEKLLTNANSLGINVQLRKHLTANINNDMTQVVQYKNTQIKIKVKMSKPGIVVLMDTWHPNWKAYANGKEVYVGRVFNAFRGIALPAGEYTLEYKYQPASMPYVYVLITFTVLTLAILLLFHKRVDSWLNAIINNYD